MKWTHAQEQAISTTGTNLIVSAAAGSGKTAVLTERIARLVCAGAEIDRFLVVTFTEAATTEMKKRIAARLMDYALCTPDAKTANRLREQAARAEYANISTLHAFCLYILRRNFHRLELDPSFTTADDLLKELLLNQALEEAAEDAYAQPEQSGILTILRALAGSQENLFSQTKRLLNFLSSQMEPEAWLRGAVEAYVSPDDFHVHPAVRQTLVSDRLHVSAAVRRYAAARAQVKNVNVQVLAHVDAELNGLRALALHNDTEYIARLLSVEFPTLRGFQKNEEKEKALLVAARDKTKETIRACAKKWEAGFAVEAKRMQSHAEALRALQAFVEAVMEKYSALKRTRNVVDFADMEHLALRALAHEDVREALKNRFQYILVDEYQDSSYIQEQIIASIQREDNLFLVGDVKQSIYKFRQAEPALFLEKLRTYTGEAGATGMQVHLNTNFRSKAPVIDAVNELFSKVMTPEAAEIDYDENAKLRLPEDAPADEHTTLAGVELHVLEKKLRAAGFSEDETDAEEAMEADAEDTLSEAEAEALIAAKRIRELMQSATYTDKEGARKLRYSDFVVLLRSVRGKVASQDAGDVWAKTLAQEGIPAYVQLTGGFFEAIEVQVFLNLLRVIDNRRQDIPLLSVLRLPMFHFDEDTLVRLVKDYPAETLFESLSLCAEDTNMLAMRVRTFFLLLVGWRAEARLLPLEEFLALVLEESRLYECFATLPGAEQRQANLDAVVARGREFASSNGAGDLWSFITYMDDAASTAKMGGASAAAADVVRVMTIHKAKGLEFPVVILGGMGKRFNMGDKSEPLLFDREWGIGTKLIAGNVKSETLLHKAIGRRIEEGRRAEEMRVLYVGMTRARERLVMLGSSADAVAAVSEARRMEITNSTITQAKSHLDWLLLALHASPVVELSVHEQSPQLNLPPRMEAGMREKTAVCLADIRARFSWRYPFEADITTPSKVNVSELSNTREVKLSDPPSFVAKEREMTPAERGSALHLALSGIQMASCPETNVRAFVEAEIARMVAAGVLSTRQAKALRLDDMEWLLTSEIGRRMRAAERLEREMEFSLEIPASAVLETKSEAPLLLQGVIDCCFLEQGAWVVLDYKTDRVHAGTSVEEAAQAHSRQLWMYANALVRLTNIPVKEMLVVMLRAKTTCEIAPGEPASFEDV